MCRYSCFLILFLVVVPGLTASVPTVIPPPGWQVESRKVYSSENLYGHINGGAELFLEFGFKELQAVRLTRGKVQLSVEMYRMTEVLSALGIYLAKCAPETPMAGVIPRNSGDRYQLAMVRGSWFIFINNFDGNRENVPLMRQLANKIAAQVYDKLLAWPCSLPEKGLVKGSVRLARGPVALQPVYTLGEGDILRLNRQIWAMLADYRVKGRTETLIRANYADEKSARTTFLSLVEKLDPYLKVIQKNETSLVFQDYAGEYGIVSLHGRMLGIRVHLVSAPGNVNGN
ncbi:MAG: hypothetical protein KAH24_02535 [Holophagae bacterium]|nr:hypothetical protein [Holophagae bacterium]